MLQMLAPLRPILFVGESGTAKTTVIQKYLSILPTTGVYIHIHVFMYIYIYVYMYVQIIFFLYVHMYSEIFINPT
jgi:hypothetical protein